MDGWHKPLMGVAASGLHIQYFEQSRRHLQALGGSAFCGHFHPVVRPLSAGLDYLKPQGARLDRCGAAQHKFVVVGIGQSILCAVGGPADFQYALGIFLAMAFIRYRQWAGDRAQGPAGLGHGLRAVETCGQHDADGTSRLTIAAVTYPERRAIAAVSGSGPVLQNHMSKRLRADQGNGADKQR